MDYLWLVILFVLGIMMVIKPEFLWKIEHIFTVKNGEPTELYLTLMLLTIVLRLFSFQTAQTALN